MAKGGGLGGLILLGALIGGGYLAWTQLGGEVSGSAPQVGRPNIDAPDPNEVGDKATELGNKAADTVMGLTPNTWKMIIIGLIALGVAVLWFRSPKFKWAIIGGGILLIFMIAVVPQMH